MRSSVIVRHRLPCLGRCRSRRSPRLGRLFPRRSPCLGRCGPCRPALIQAAGGATATRAAALSCLLLAALACARPAGAQLSGPSTDFPVGELHRVELLGSLWPPAQDLTVAHRGSGASGTTTGMAGDAGAPVPRFMDLRVRLRLSRRQRVHFDYLPVRYDAVTAPDHPASPADADRGAGAAVASTLTWRTWRLAYEYDLIHLARGSLGLFAEATYTDVRIARDSGCVAGSAACELARMRRPIPAVGSVVRLYPSPVIMLGAEASLLRMPWGIGDFLGYDGEHLAYDVHAVLNFIDAFGLQLGYRSRNLSLRTTKQDYDLKLEGVYAGALLRF